MTNSAEHYMMGHHQALSMNGSNYYLISRHTYVLLNKILSRVSMVRFGNIKAIARCICVAIALQSHTVLAQDNQALLDRYLLEIEEHISSNNLEGARDKLTEALTANLRDERLEVVQGQLRLLESMNQSDAPALAAASDGGSLTDQDKMAATDLLDSLRVAMENGELEKVRIFTDPTPQTNSLLEAVFTSYTGMRIEVSAPEADQESQSYLATIEFKELTTEAGDTAFPAQAWKTHRVRVIKTDGIWQKVLW